MLPRYIEGRLFSLFKPSYASKQEINKRQKGCDRFQAFKHENSQGQFGLCFVKDTFTLHGSSKCEVLSVLDLSDAFHSLRLTKKSKKILWNITILWQCLLLIPKDANEIKYFPSSMAIIHKYYIKLLIK